MKNLKVNLPSKFFKRLFLLSIALTFMAIGITIVIKASLGQSTLSAFAYSISAASSIKIGTVLIFLNIIFFLGELVIVKGKIPLFQWLQVPANVLFGEMINFFNYDFELLNIITQQAYPVRVIFMLVGALILGIMVALINHIDLIILPFEAIILLYSKVKKINYRRFRTLVDFTLVSSSLLLMFIYRFDVSPVREGTAIIALSLGSVIQVSMRYWEKWVRFDS
jgi:uncharacterized protein